MVALDRYRSALYLICLVVLPCIVYWQGLSFGFVDIDDGGQVFDNVHAQSLSLKSLYHFLTNPVVGMYQPLTSLTNAILISCFGSHAPSFHTFSLIIHIINTILVFKISSNILGSKSRAVFLALMFSAHPLYVESVMWVSALSTLLFSLFFLSALLCYLHYLESKSPMIYAMVIFCFLLGLLSKVQAAPFVGIVFLVDYLKARPITLKATGIEKSPLILIALIFIAIALYFRGEQNSFPGYDYSPLLLMPSQIAWYPFKLFAPTQLSAFYDWPQTLWNAFTLFSYAVFALIIWLIYQFRQNRLVIFGILFYFANIILHTSLFTQFLSPYADRYAYLSSLGIFFAAMGLVPDKLFDALEFGLVCLVLGLSFLARQQVAVWENTIEVWSKNLLHQSATFSNAMRGALYYQQGDFQSALTDFQTFDQAPDFRLEPEKSAYLYNAMGIMSANKDKEKALEYFLKVLRFTQEPAALLNVARILSELERHEQEEAIYHRILAEHPQHSMALNSLSNLYFRTGRLEPMIGLLDKLVSLHPKEVEFYKKRAYINHLLGNKELAQADTAVVSDLLAPSPALNIDQLQQ